MIVSNIRTYHLKDRVLKALEQGYQENDSLLVSQHGTLTLCTVGEAVDFLSSPHFDESLYFYRLFDSDHGEGLAMIDTNPERYNPSYDPIHWDQEVIEKEERG